MLRFTSARLVQRINGQIGSSIVVYSIIKCRTHDSSICRRSVVKITQRSSVRDLVHEIFQTYPVVRHQRTCIVSSPPTFVYVSLSFQFWVTLLHPTAFFGYRLLHNLLFSTALFFTFPTYHYPQRPINNIPHLCILSGHLFRSALLTGTEGLEVGVNEGRTTKI